MDRLIGEVFYYTNYKLQVNGFKPGDCEKCEFQSKSCSLDKDVPECVDSYRADRTNVFFTKWKECI